MAGESDYLVCVREQEDQEFLHHVSGVDRKEVFQLVHGHKSADLKGKVRANITFTDEHGRWGKVNVLHKDRSVTRLFKETVLVCHLSLNREEPSC